MTRIGKVISNGYEKTKAASKEATKEIFDVANMPKDIKNGFQYGRRLSKIQKATPCDTFVTVGRSMLRKGVIPHLPGIFAGLGFAIPVIGANPAGFALGKVLKKALRKI